MFKYKVTGMDKAIARMESLRNPLTREEASKMGTRMVMVMKDLISKGISPIRGKGKFPRYKNPDKYPGDRKNHSPVNLKLSGDFLNNLLSKVVTLGPNKFAVEIGYRDDDQAIKERGHREGANGQPKRPTIPNPKGREQFAESIADEYRKIILAAIRNK